MTITTEKYRKNIQFHISIEISGKQTQRNDMQLNLTS